MLGSHNVYGHKGREAEASVNFVTCHDGFSLNDLVSYNVKHNEANGEQNRDGADDNRSWNCGVEGPTDDPQIERLRNRQVKNFLTVTLLSLGVPMILMGDEVRRTQRGNNNAYCHDDEANWFDWTLRGEARRRSPVREPARSRDGQLRDQTHESAARQPDARCCEHAKTAWHGVKRPAARLVAALARLAFGAEMRREGLELYLIMNAYWEPLDFELPALSEVNGGAEWIDTSLEVA